MMIKKYFGDKAFYKMVLAVVVPIILQNGISNFVGLLDNIMVGRIGTEQMSGVSIANQLMMVYNLAIFGAVSGAGIFCAQFYGCGNNKGVQQAFRFKLILCGLLSIIGIFVFGVFGENLIALFLQGGGDAGDVTLALHSGREYLNVMLIGLIPFSAVQSYSSTLRETGETVLPMKAGIVAVLVNLVLNYLLIYDHFGMKGMGVVGAAIATVISRFVEMLIVLVWTHAHKKEHIFAEHLYSHFYIPGNLVWNIVKKGTPLMLNEFLCMGI